MYNNNVVAIIQARMTSSRLPGKVLLPLANKPVLQHIIERLRRSKYIDGIVVACTTNEADEAIIDLCDDIQCGWFRGSEDNVLHRVINAAKKFKADIIVDVTSDCPCVCPEHADHMIERLINCDVDYVSNVINRTYPRGLDIQVFWTHVLHRVDFEVDNDVDRQHVSTWIYKNPKNFNKYKLHNCESRYDYSDVRITLDTEEDYKLLNLVFNMFNDNDFSDGDLYALKEYYPELFEINKHIPQKNYYKELSEWYLKNTQL